jgi:hypothetical protein
MRKRLTLIVAGAAALGGASFLLPAIAAGGGPAVVANIEIECVEGVGGALTHAYTVTVTNNTDGTITILTETDSLTVNGEGGDIADPDMSDVPAGDTATYPQAVPLVPDGDESVTAVYSATYNGGQSPITVTATAEPCGATTTTSTTTTVPLETPPTSTPAVVAPVDFAG